VIELCTGFPRELVASPCLEILKIKLGTALVDPDLIREVELNNLQRFLPTSTIL